MKLKNKNHVCRMIPILLVLLILYSFTLTHAVERDVNSNRKKADNFVLVNQEGQTIRLDQFQGKSVVMGFFFTRCAMPRMCPLTTKKFVQLQKLLRENGLTDEVVLLLVSFDPEFDVPGILKKYAGMYDAVTDNFHFLTGDETAITKVCQDYGIIHEDQESGQIRHSMVTYLIGQEGFVRKFHVGQNWTPDGVSQDIMSLQETIKPEGRK